MGRAPLAVSRLYVSGTEHKAVFDGGRFSPEAMTLIPVDRDGVVDLHALSSLLDAHDKASGLPMVAVMAANNETGVLQPIAEIARLTHQAGGLLVVDAVQAPGRLPLDIDAIEADFLILSSHKIGGPKGAGALVARGETLMPAPLLRGGGQEKGHRSGTENAGAIAGFGVAAALAARDVDARAASLRAMRDRIETEMADIAPDMVIHGRNAPRLPNTSFFSLDGLKPETGQIAFDLEGVALSAGSACSSGKVSESHVLKAMGLDPRLGALRISIGSETTEADAALFISAFRKVTSRLNKADAA
jgi:cysteine desulfurase